MASGWESEGPGFAPRQPQATFDPGLSKNNKQFPAKYSAPLINKNFARRTSKDLKK